MPCFVSLHSDIIKIGAEAGLRLADICCVSLGCGKAGPATGHAHEDVGRPFSNCRQPQDGLL